MLIMSSTSGIRIDSLLHSLKELQNEKNCLEQKLYERKSEVQTLERRLEQCNAKLTQVKEMEQKLTEMQKVAVQKVQQTQQQVDSLHQYNLFQSGQIQELNRSIKQEKDNGLRNIEKFQDKMSDLAKKLIEARKFYKAENLQSSINETRAKIHQLELEMTADNGELSSITETMEKLQLNPISDTMQEQICHQTRLLVWKMLEEEEKMVRASLQRLQTEQQEICAVLQESTNSQTPM